MFTAVNEGISTEPLPIVPLPLAAKPIDVLSLVQVYVVPATPKALAKVTSVVEVALHNV